MPLALEAPFASTKVEVIEPGLVDVDHTYATRQLCQHELSVVLLQEEVAVQVTEEENFLDHGILGTDVVP